MRTTLPLGFLNSGVRSCPQAASSPARMLASQRCFRNSWARVRFGSRRDQVVAGTAQPLAFMMLKSMANGPLSASALSSSMLALVFSALLVSAMTLPLERRAGSQDRRIADVPEHVGDECQGGYGVVSPRPRDGGSHRRQKSGPDRSARPLGVRLTPL